MSILPSLSDTSEPTVVTIGDIEVTFQLRVIPGKLWAAIVDHDPAPKISEIAVRLLTAGVASFHTSTAPDDEVQFAPPVDELARLYDPTKPEFGWPSVDGHPATAAAIEVWETWPPGARKRLYDEVVRFNIVGRPNPFGTSAKSVT